jgi:hypothetical protein
VVAVVDVDALSDVVSMLCAAVDGVVGPQLQQQQLVGAVPPPWPRAAAADAVAVAGADVEPSPRHPAVIEEQQRPATHSSPGAVGQCRSNSPTV